MKPASGKQIASFMLVALLATACVSHRKKGQPSAFGRFYHNTTSKYNGYFNANELMDEVLLAQRQGYKDNYNKVLAVFPEAASGSADGVKPKLDKAIEKVSVVITNHRVSHWTDDCYLLLAKAQYLKRDYETAENSFRYFLESFDPLKDRVKTKKIKARSVEEKKEVAQATAKDRKKAAELRAKDRKKAQKEKAKAKKKAKKEGQSKSKPQEQPSGEAIVSTPAKIPVIAPAAKEDENKASLTNEGSWLVPHYPAYWEGAIWAGRNLVERGKPYEAEQLYRKVEQDPYARPSLRGLLYASYADLYLRTGNQARAIASLKSAIEFADSKTERARFAFILGQLYQQNARYESSNQYFETCLKQKPSYELAFHARLNLLINEVREGNEPASIASKIQKLIDDPKNADYQSTMYYALAAIYLQQGAVEEAKAQFQNSLRAPNASNDQKAETYYQLAGLHFERQQYLPAKNYYDSTMALLAKEDGRRSQVGKIVANLEEIARHLSVIALNDSLLRIAALPVKEKRALAIQLKNSKKAKVQDLPKENRSRFAELDAFAATPFDRTGGAGNQNKKTASQFFAYDQRTTNRGRSQFEQQWGDRPLEDNWRRKNKTSFIAPGSVVAEEAQAADSLESDLAQILKGIPETPEQAEVLHNSIAESMFQLGVLYREKLDNYTKSNQTFADLLQKYPRTGRKPDALYYSYLNCLDLDDSACANSLGDQIAYEFPGSHYARLLNDKEYVRQLMERKDEITLQYDEAYNRYQNGQYREAQEILVVLRNKMAGGHKLFAKSTLLSAFCLGQTEGKDAYVNALRDVVANFPGTPEEVKAKEILRFLKGDQDAFIQIRESELEKFNFKEEENKMHFILVLLYNPEERMTNKIKISISDYHENYHRQDKLKMTSVELDTESNNPILVIRKFDNARQALKYVEGVMKKPLEYIQEFDNWEILAVTQNNYREILRLKSLSEYKSFYKKTYEKTN